jgi:hypothetical protein
MSKAKTKLTETIQSSSHDFKKDKMTTLDAFFKYNQFELHDPISKRYFRFRDETSIQVQLLPQIQIECCELTDDQIQELTTLLADFPRDSLSEQKNLISYAIEWITEARIVQLKLDTADSNCIGNEVDGFLDDDDSEEESAISSMDQLPPVAHTKTRKIKVYVWGRKTKHNPTSFVQRNFNACVLHGKKKGVDWRQNGRDSEEVRLAVMKCRLFPTFMLQMINVIERDDLHVIAINCAKGRHRSATSAYMLKYYYPDVQIEYMCL